jgi:peroxiredoxin
MSVQIGSPAPGFTLPDTEGTLFPLDRVRGRKTLIVFIPFPFTAVCEAELCTLRDHLADLSTLDANVVAITCDTRFANKKWSELNGFGFPVLSDFWPHGEVSRSYGTFNEDKGCANRTTFVLDASGVVREIVASDALGTPREYAAYVEALRRF